MILKSITASWLILRSILIVIFMCGILGIGLVYYMYHWHMSQDVTIIIPQNTTLLSIADILEAKSIVPHKYLFLITFKIYTAYHNQTIKAGEYKFTKYMKTLDIFKIMIGGIVVKHKLTIPEGYTVAQIIQLVNTAPSIINLPVIEIGEINEGSLLPDTYFYTYGTTNLDLLFRMHQSMIEFIRMEWPKRDIRIDNIINDENEALVLASIVEKETSLMNERALVAGVYLHRLKKGMKLQADPTVIYGITQGIADFKRKVLYRDLKHTSVYNTYMHSGLPPTPICNPGKKAILAALHPQWTNKLYFVADGSGGHLFSSSFQEHKNNIAQIKAIINTSAAAN